MLACTRPYDPARWQARRPPRSQTNGPELTLRPAAAPQITSEFTDRPPSESANPLVSEYDRSTVPEGLVTRRQLREMGLSPGGNEGPVAILRCRLCATRPQWSCRHPTRGYLLRVDLAVPKRVPTLAQEWALDQAMAARQTCGQCGRRFYICL
ncbi:RRQRL motif-containing zinc-binding protein [Streptomyces nigra]|uniref:RRQRL motif-containing zinc-binding protein n=1 Tax=Streptomyces nigra TaxID=1827580 RepID=UPI0036B7416B